MVTKRPISFFVTEKGRSLSFGIITTAGIGFTLAKFAPHTFLLDKYKEFVHYYKSGKPADLPKEISDRCKECLDLLNVSNVHRKLISPFSVYGFDLFHAGSTASRFGAAIGIPVNFTYSKYEDIDKDIIQVNQKNIDWESETGKKLADAMILPEQVQKFAICREILMTQNKKVFYESAYPFACVFFAYNLSCYLNARLNLYAAHPIIRGTMYTIIGTFSLGIYFLLKDMTEVYYESEVDKKLCELGTEFIECGVTFYDKLLQRNQALRELMGRKGELKYSKLGNENYLLRQPRIALVHRKQYFEQMLKEAQNENSSAVVEE